MAPRYSYSPRARKQISLRLDLETIEYLDREALLLSARPPYLDITASDIVRYALREYRSRHQPAEAAPPRPKCDVIESPGGTYCTFCGSRGEVGSQPACRLTNKETQ
jgi:hypothetical protein